MEIALSLNFIRLMTIISFLLIIILIFFKYFILRNDINNTKVHKIIGGLGVFIVATISSNSYILFLSLFIGGLIIASEDFMKFLAAIVKTRNDRVSETIKAFKATDEEILNKQKVEEQEEICEKEIKKIQRPDDSGKEEHIVKREEYMKKRVMVEEAVLDYYSRVFKDNFKRGIKFVNQGSSFISDGAIYYSPNKPMMVIEVKYFKSLSGTLQFIIQRTVERIKFILPDTMIIFNIVVEDTPSIKDVDRVLSFINRYKQLNLQLFKYKNEKLIEVVKEKQGLIEKPIILS